MRIATLISCLLLAACEQSVEPFTVARIDRTVASSAYPVATNPAAIGTYPGLAKSGAGYFYDDVLEYRVWMHPEQGAERIAGDKDYFAAFATYEVALKYSKSRPGAEAPLVLVRQREHVNEPKPGEFEWVKEERIAEWKPEWLAGTHREATSIPEFLEQHKAGSAKPAAAN